MMNNNSRTIRAAMEIYASAGKGGAAAALLAAGFSLAQLPALLKLGAWMFGA